MIQVIAQIIYLKIDKNFWMSGWVINFVQKIAANKNE